MSYKAQAVIGANWGDEGKGLAVDRLAAAQAESGLEAVVVRSNGGAQAGHGVERPEGGRHVFHHVGAGTFTGAATHLSQFFVAHPMVLGTELSDLDALNARPRRITIDPRAAITTPWDMALNQALEIQRAGGRHGSTGLGFGETIERQERGFALTAADLWSSDLHSKLTRVRDEWLPGRIAELGVDLATSPLAPILTGKADLVSRFIEDCAAFRARVDLLDDAKIARAASVIFEGAQGLQLDMDYGVFPHVTRSYTGLRNMAEIAREAGIEQIAPLYMTRAYATRHGAGPLPHEAPGPDGIGRIDWAEIIDLTNAPNDWQGTIREAPLDGDLLRTTIARDIALGRRAGLEIIPSIGVSCLDQVRSRGVLVQQDEARMIGASTLAEEIAAAACLPLGLKSEGPTRSTAEVFPASITPIAA